MSNMLLIAKAPIAAIIASTIQRLIAMITVPITLIAMTWIHDDDDHENNNNDDDKDGNGRFHSSPLRREALTLHASWQRARGSR